MGFKVKFYLGNKGWASGAITLDDPRLMNPCTRLVDPCTSGFSLTLVEISF